MRLNTLLSLLFADAIAFSLQTRNRTSSRLFAKEKLSSLLGANKPFTPAPGSLDGQTIVITGGSGGLGLESAKRLAIGGASIILTARSVEKAEQAVSEVKKYSKEKSAPNEKISYKLLDLDDLRDVRNVPETWKDVERIDVLLNNAGIMALPKMELTVDGYEKQMQSNHLGHFALTALLSSKFAPDARVINVSSSAHQFAPKGMLSGDALWKPDSFDYSGWPVYGQSKLANILFTKELQRRCTAAGKDWYVTHYFSETVYHSNFQTNPFNALGLSLACILVWLPRVSIPGRPDLVNQYSLSFQFLANCRPRKIHHRQ